MDAGNLQVVIDADISAFQEAMANVVNMLGQMDEAMKSLTVSFAENAEQINDSGKGVLDSVTKIGGSFLTGLDTVNKLSSGFLNATSVFTGFKSALTGNPIGLIITLIAGLIAVAITCYNKFDSFRAVVDATWAVLKDLAVIVVDGVLAGLKILYDIVSYLCELFYDLGTIVGAFLIAPFKIVIDLVEALYYATIGHDWSKAGEAMKKVGTDTKEAANMITDSVEDIVDNSKKMAANVSEDFTNGLTKVTDTLSHITDDASDAYKKAFEKTKEVSDAKVNVKEFTITPEKIKLDTGGASIPEMAMQLPKLSMPAQQSGPNLSSLDSTIDKLDFITEASLKAREAMLAFGGTPLDALKSQLGELRNRMQELINSGAYGSDEFAGLKAKFDSVTQAIKAEEDAHKRAGGAADGHKKALEELGDIGKTAVNSLGDALGEIATGKKNPMSALFTMLATAVKQLGTYLIGIGLATAEIGLGAAYVVGGVALEALSVVIGASATKMAAGGLVSGSSFVNVGEYAGANHNPEVIAPLDKLRGMIGGGSQHHTFEISGDKLVSVLQRVDNNNSFALGGQ